MAYRLESWLYRKSAMVTGQTKGICESIRIRFPAVKTHWLPNGIDPGRFDPTVQSEWRLANNFSPDDFIVCYAGIIGHAQGLDVLLNTAARMKDHPDIKFVILGDGPEKERLLEREEKEKLANVYFYDSIPREEMPAFIQATDIAVVPLKRIELFKGAIPSKIFENLAMKKPLLLGVEGEAKKLFVDEGRCGLAFEPENDTHLAAQILLLKNNTALCQELGNNGQSFVHAFFNRKKITAELISALNALG
jgi:glycosyltransferase involved in cell wall biosynthesis